MSVFLNEGKPNLTVMLQCEKPEIAINRIEKAISLGADSFGLQVENLLPQYQSKEYLSKIFATMQNKPCYVTNYRSYNNQGKSDEQLVMELLEIAKYGGTLFDLMGDCFDKQPGELTLDKNAIEKQMTVIEQLHNMGKEVLMSSHIYKFLPAERVLEIAFEQKRRGADIIKIVTVSDNMEQQLENLKTTNLLKNELNAPFLFLSTGESSIHRRVGMKLGCCMSLCVYEHDSLSTPAQPLLSVMKEIRDNDGF